MADSEKITVNLNAVDLGKIDLLVQEGLYTNRTDFIRSAIRSQIDKHQIEVQQAVSRYSYQIGIIGYNKADLERYIANGEKIHTTVIGLLHLSSDITPELASEAIESVRVRGVFEASDAVKTALADRMK